MAAAPETTPEVAAGFSASQCRAVDRAIFEHRDMRRLLTAAHHAHSVGFMFEEPMLQQERWASRCALDDLLFENSWSTPPANALALRPNRGVRRMSAQPLPAQQALRAALSASTAGAMAAVEPSDSAHAPLSPETSQ